MSKKRNLLIDYIPASLAAILIIFSAISREQTLIKTLPTVITLVVQLMLVRTNRLAFLLGGFNSALYAISFYDESLYFSAFFALFISMPIQIYSYFNWKKNAKGNDPNIRALPTANLLAVSAITIIAWLLLWKLPIGSLIQGKYIAFDSLIFVIGAVSTVLSSIRFVDAQYFSLASAILSLILWIIITVKQPENINYVIIAIYNIFRGVEITVSWLKRTIVKDKTPEDTSKTNFLTMRKENAMNKKIFLKGLALILAIITMLGTVAIIGTAESICIHSTNKELIATDDGFAIANVCVLCGKRVTDEGYVSNNESFMLYKDTAKTPYTKDELKTGFSPVSKETPLYVDTGVISNTSKTPYWFTFDMTVNALPSLKAGSNEADLTNSNSRASKGWALITMILNGNYLAPLRLMADGWETESGAVGTTRGNVDGYSQIKFYGDNNTYRDKPTITEVKAGDTEELSFL